MPAHSWKCDLKKTKKKRREIMVNRVKASSQIQKHQNSIHSATLLLPMLLPTLQSADDAFRSTARRAKWEWCAQHYCWNWIEAKKKKKKVTFFFKQCDNSHDFNFVAWMQLKMCLLWDLKGKCHILACIIHVCMLHAHAGSKHIIQRIFRFRQL